MATPIESKIEMKERIANDDRAFGASCNYFPVWVYSGIEAKFALFTERQIDTAIERGRANLEDIRPAKKSFWEKVFRL